MCILRPFPPLFDANETKQTICLKWLSWLSVGMTHTEGNHVQFKRGGYRGANIVEIFKKIIISGFGGRSKEINGFCNIQVTIWASFAMVLLIKIKLQFCQVLLISRMRWPRANGYIVGIQYSSDLSGRAGSMSCNKQGFIKSGLFPVRRQQQLQQQH